MDNVYSDAPPKKRAEMSVLRFLLVLLLVAGISGGATFGYLKWIEPGLHTPPALHFSAGTGIINETQKVLYVAVSGDKQIALIHGVSLYDGAFSEPVPEEAVPVTTAYEYTKNDDSTYRVIYFDMEPLAQESGKQYTYTFSMQFSFADSERIYPYCYTVTFDGNINGDISEIVFDKQSDTPKTDVTEPTAQAPTTAPSQEQTTAQTPADIQFIYEGYWFTAPVTQGDTREISALKFRADGTYTQTVYKKDGDADWRVSTQKGNYTQQGAQIILDALTLAVNSDAKTLEAASGEPLTARKYNSIKNVEDFFGL